MFIPLAVANRAGLYVGPTVGGFSVTDDFNRADGPIGSNWTQDGWHSTGPLSIVSNKVPMPITSAGVGCYYYNNGTFAADHYSEVTITDIGSYTDDVPGVVVRHSDIGSVSKFYWCHMSIYFGGYLRLAKFTEDPYADTGFIDAGGYWGTFADGDVFRVEAIDEGSDVRLNVYMNGGLIATHLDTSSPLTGGNPGLFFPNKHPAPVCDSWTGGDV